MAFTPQNRVRIVTAAALFDGHDAAINIMRRLMQRAGAEVIHLGHNRSAAEIVDAAVMEDAQAVAITSYQGGHVEFFKYVVDLLKERAAPHILVFGGGGGVIVEDEIKELEAYGVTKIYSPEDGRTMGLKGMIEHLVKESDFEAPRLPLRNGRLADADTRRIASILTQAENGGLDGLPGTQATVPVVGLTGPGGAGKSVMTDELLRRFLLEFPGKRAAILSVDPSRKRTGGALLGDRIRMNCIRPERVFMRSFATRGSGTELSSAIGGAIQVCKAAGYDLVFVETSGIGQGGTGITDVSDISCYVMTPEYGAASQLEKIDMLDFADVVAVNKCDRRGAEDALRDVRKQLRRNREIPATVPDGELPVFGTIASRFNDTGVNRLFTHLLGLLDRELGTTFLEERATDLPGAYHDVVIVPPDRERYLGEISQCARDYRQTVERKAAAATRLYRLQGAADALGGEVAPDLAAQIEVARASVGADGLRQLEAWQMLVQRYRAEEFVREVRGRELRGPLFDKSLAGTPIPKVALPRYADWGDRLRWLLLENVPGEFPFTSGVFHLRRTDEDPTRMFAGEGPPERTNRRFHYLCKGHKARRLSVAFDSVTLYGEDPDERPDIYGKIGESGVSICTLEDMRKLFKGFDLSHTSTSVSMTINGPAPTILAMFMNAAVDQQVDRFREEQGREPKVDEFTRLRDETLRQVRGTVQADILKEDQAQNTCIFGTEFSLKMMGDIQEFFVRHQVRNYYSVSISGYHIAEAGANPITQLALTLANGLTYVEYYLSRGMPIDEFAGNLSFFFSNGLDPEYTVIGRVARRIWSVVMRERYGAGERSQKLKYHIQTSGRSLHAQEVSFNDIRTTLQALLALNDNCNSLHTNAYDEAITTPTEESARRAMAIQLIVNREYGLMKSENALQGSFVVDELTDLVEEAVLCEFERLDERGGVLGAMERGYQRSRIQEESLSYEQQKNSGELPITGVNFYVNPDPDEVAAGVEELTRATPEEKRAQLDNLRRFQAEHADETAGALQRLRQVALEGKNTFEELLRTVRSASLGQITRTLYDVGGQYRRSM
ncbi:MAG: fused isobutyryl-CoA mutase/GTPase IcmF [Planctomycetota bacterium]|jgi:methylmalonyl-CoA mutase